MASDEERCVFISSKGVVKGYGVLGLIVGLGAGLALGTITAERRAASEQPEKVINWEPANRFEMHINTANGDIWRLDRATGAIHANEYRNGVTND